MKRRPDVCPSAPLAPHVAPDPAAQAEARAWEAELLEQVPASSLTQPQRNAVWRHVKAHHPERVAFLNDPLVQQLISGGASPTFPRELIRTALSEAKKVATHGA